MDNGGKTNIEGFIVGGHRWKPRTKVGGHMWEDTDGGHRWEDTDGRTHVGGHRWEDTDGRTQVGGHICDPRTQRGGHRLDEAGRSPERRWKAMVRRRQVRCQYTGRRTLVGGKVCRFRWEART